MQIKYSFLCEAANITHTGNLNVLGIFDNINAKNFPCVHPHCVYIARISFHRSEIGRHPFKLSFIDDDGNEVIPPLNGEIAASQNNMNANILMNILNIKFQHAGEYHIDLTIDNQNICSDTIRLIQTQ